MKTVYPKEPIRDFEEWREWIKQQVLTAKEERIIEDFKQSIINARTKKNEYISKLFLYCSTSSGFFKNILHDKMEAS